MRALLLNGHMTICLSILLLAACVPAPAATPVAVLATATPAVTASPTPTGAPTPMPTATPTPTLTATLAPTATPTLTATQLPTPTGIPEPTNTLASVAPTNTPTVDPDPDRDGISTSEENVYGTDPSAADPWDDFDFPSEILNTPDKVAYYMRHHLKFIYDAPCYNHFQSAQETFMRGGGDCEDSAMFAFQVLSQNGWSFMGNGWGDSGNWVGGFNVQWVEADPRGGHAVCLYKPSDQPLYYIDNDVQQLGIVRGPFASLEKVVTDISSRSHGEWRWYEFFDLNWNFGYGKVNRQ